MKTYSFLCAEFYDLTDHVNGEKAMQFFMNKAHSAAGPILEPMCGTGRFLIPLLQAGIDCDGFDASQAMLDRLFKKSENAGFIKPRVWKAFVQNFTSSRLYNLIFIPYGSWGLILNRSEALEGLKNVRRHLLPGGMLLLEIETIASVPTTCGQWHYGVRTRFDKTQIALKALTSYNQETQIFQSLSYYELLQNNNVIEVEEEVFEQYLYKPGELDLLLHEAGFSYIKKYCAYDETEPVTEGSPLIIYECKS